MASCVRNICAKNSYNPLILFKVTVDNVGVPFLRNGVEFVTFLGERGDKAHFKRGAAVPRPVVATSLEVLGQQQHVDITCCVGLCSLIRLISVSFPVGRYQCLLR